MTEVVAAEQKPESGQGVAAEEHLRARPARAAQWLWRSIRGHKIATAVIILVAWFAIEIALLPFGEIESLRTRNPRETAFMREHRQEAMEEGKPFRILQQWVPLGRMPRHVIDAVIVSEDGSFWSHDGFDWYELWESIVKNVREQRAARGASTITQQLVKNLYLSSSKNPARKLREWMLTWWMERQLGKKRILELYLNVIEWGRGVYGIQAASQTYFGKNVEELTREEAARLAAVIPNPRRYRADVESRYVTRRANLILERMAARGL